MTSEYVPHDAKTQPQRVFIDTGLFAANNINTFNANILALSHFHVNIPTVFDVKQCELLVYNYNSFLYNFREYPSDTLPTTFGPFGGTNRFIINGVAIGENQPAPYNGLVGLMFEDDVVTYINSLAIPGVTMSHDPILNKFVFTTPVEIDFVSNIGYQGAAYILGFVPENYTTSPITVGGITYPPLGPVSISTFQSNIYYGIRTLKIDITFEGQRGNGINALNGDMDTFIIPVNLNNIGKPQTYSYFSNFPQRSYFSKQTISRLSVKTFDATGHAISFGNNPPFILLEFS